MPVKANKKTTTSATAPTTTAPATPIKVPSIPVPKVVSAPPVSSSVVVKEETSAIIDNTSSSPSVYVSALEDLNSQLNSVMEQMKKICTDYRILQKNILKERKQNQKKSKKVTTTPSTNKVSGFAKPGFISPQLCDFLGVKHGTELARTDVTKKLTQYIKDHNLQDANNKRVIVLDDNLKKLLTPGPGEVITYFNLQSFMKKHYKSASSSIVPPAI